MLGTNRGGLARGRSLAAICWAAVEEHMTESELDCVCEECGEPADACATAPEEWRCPECGCHQRRFSLRVREYLFIRETTRGKVKTPGLKRRRIEFVEGDDLHRDSGRWMKLSRQIDRGNDRYRKKIVDPKTGLVVHECDEPLSKHRGHGSAKRKE